MAPPIGSPKYAGRKKGTPNKRTVAKQNAMQAINAIGKTPLQVLLELMALPDNSREFQADLAMKAAPYCHPRFTSTEFRDRTGDGQVQGRRLSNAERARALLLLAAQAQEPDDDADNDDRVTLIARDG